MADESLVGIVDLVSGEKDPRNLMLVFSMIRVLMLEWDITNHAETLFDSVYAYFPITFRPPPNDPYGITAQDLKDRLRDCIASTHQLAPYAIPNLIDKLDSTSPNVKRDVFQALQTCAQTYEPRIMSQYSIPLWDSIKFEVLSAQEPELSDGALVTLKAIASNLSKDLTNSGPTSFLAQYLRPVTKECNEHIQEPAQRQAKASGDILRFLSSANVFAYTLIVKNVLPPIFTIYQDVGVIMKQRALMEIVNLLLDSCIETFGTWKEPNLSSPIENPLLQFKDRMLEVYSQALMGTVKEEVSFRMTAANGLVRMCKIRNFMQDNEIGLIVQHLNDIVLKEEDYGRDDLKRTAMECLAELSKYKPRPIMDITFPAFMAELPDDDDTAEARRDYHSTLEGLAEISVEKEPFEVLVRRLLSKLDILLQTANLSKPSYSRAILSTILHAMSCRSLADDPNLPTYFEKIVEGLVSKAMEANPANQSALSDESVLEVLGRLVNLIARNATQEKQFRVAALVRTLQAKGSEGSVASIVGEPNCVPRMVLSAWLLAALPKDVKGPGFDAEDMAITLQELVSIASVQNPDQHAAQLATLRQIALYINKHLPPKQLSVADTLLASVYSSVGTIQEGASSVTAPDDTTTTNRIYLVFVITKALVLRLAPSTASHIQRLLTLLTPSLYPEATTRAAALAFRTLLLPDPVLSPVNYFTIRLLAPQRLFTTIIPSISASFRAASSPLEKENYLIALSGILGTVPKEVVMPELPTLLPLLLQSLDLHDVAVKLATIQTILVVITENCGALLESGHIDALVKRLLRISASAAGSIRQAERCNAMEQNCPAPVVDPPAARERATNLLARLPTAVSRAISSSSSKSASANPLLSLKTNVLRTLTKVLDDPRRDVRKEAVDARAAWLRGVDELEDDSD